MILFGFNGKINYFYSVNRDSQPNRILSNPD